MTRRGHITTYAEQGAEGRVEWVFEDEALLARNEPAILFLQNGQRLNIIDVWQGIVDLLPLTATDSGTLGGGMWAENKQRDVPFTKWMGWFSQQPPLRAEIHD